MLESWTCRTSDVHTGLVEGRECETRVRAEGLKGSASLGRVLVLALLPVPPPWSSQRPVLCLSFPSVRGDNDLVEGTRWITLKCLKTRRSADMQSSFGSCNQCRFQVFNRQQKPFSDLGEDFCWVLPCVSWGTGGLGQVKS